MDLDSATQSRVDTWLKGKFDQTTKEEIQHLLSNDKAMLRDIFYTDLAFGTGGLRGLMGIGANRMNIYTVRRATLGLARYIEQKEKQGSVVIGFDSRNNSKLFAEETARTLAAQGIKVFLFKELRPTPFISFACRHLGCTAAVMITASHNPALYNGYKVYWSDGGQIVSPHDKGIMDEVLKIERYDDIAISPKDHPLIHSIGDELDEKYIAAIRPVSRRQKDNKEYGKQLRIVFSSLHGTGATLAPKALNDWGFSSVHLVEKQCIPDGNFPTVKYPNPEYIETLSMGLDEMKKGLFDILLVTDPDADRLGIAVMHEGNPVVLNGNETASLCTWYIAEQEKKMGHALKDAAVVTTIVSTDLIPALAKAYDMQCVEVLTGFKYIGEQIHTWEEAGSTKKFLFGAEESYGYLAGTHARDKDAIVSCCLLAEIALFARQQEKTLVDLLHDIYRRHGLYRERQYSIDFAPGKEGMDTMKQIMKTLRDNPLSELEGDAVAAIEDYLTKEKTVLSSGAKQALTLPTSDVILYRFACGSKLVIRPSGTEPKLKIYAGVHIPNVTDIDSATIEADRQLDRLIENTKRIMGR